MKKLIGLAMLLMTVSLYAQQSSTHGYVVGLANYNYNVVQIKLSTGEKFGIDPSSPGGKAQFAFVLIAQQNGTEISINYTPGVVDAIGTTQAQTIYTSGIIW